MTYSHFILFVGAERLVKHLFDKNVPICLATSSSKESFDVKTINHKDLFKLFQHTTMGSSDPEVAHGKPAPDIFLVAASKFSDKPKPENVTLIVYIILLKLIVNVLLAYIMMHEIRCEVIMT